MAYLDAVDGSRVDAAMGFRRRAVAWVQRHPLVVCLPVQAVLLFTDLGRLPIWGDEQTSLARAVFGAVPGDTLHPPLYFSLLHGWLAALCDGPCIVGARALSGLFVLAATVAIDRCWLRTLDPRSRTWFLILWTLSPALLLYGRMARSYSLQMLLACLALHAGSRYAQRPTLPVLLAYVVSAIALLYTHYLPGIAVVAGISTAIAWRALAHRQPAALWPALLSLVVIGFALVPWLPRFGSAVERVTLNSGYHVVGRFLDVALALAFTAVSFSVGESLWPWMAGALLVLAPLLATVLLRGLRAPPVPAALLPAAARPRRAPMGRRWHRRVRGPGSAVARRDRRLRRAVRLSQQGLSAAHPGIADAIRAGAHDEPVTVVLDHHSSDLSAVAALLPREARILDVVDSRSVAQAVALSTEPGLRQVWFVHSTHDVSAEHWNGLVGDAFAKRFTVRRTEFVPYSALDRWLMRLAGWPHRPRYAIDLIEMQYAGEGR